MTVIAKHRGWNYWARRAMVKGALAAGIALLLLIPTRAAAQEAAPTYSVLYDFTGGADGSFPTERLIPDAAGNLLQHHRAGGDFSGNCAPYRAGAGRPLSWIQAGKSPSSTLSRADRMERSLTGD